MSTPRTATDRATRDERIRRLRAGLQTRKTTGASTTTRPASLDSRLAEVRRRLRLRDPGS